MLRLVLLVGFAILAGCDQIPASSQKQNPAPVGRWLITHSPHVQRDTMLLDTVTGNTWQLVKLEKEEDSAMGWEFVGKLDHNDNSVEAKTWEDSNSQ